MRSKEDRSSPQRARPSRLPVKVITLLTDFGTTDYFVGAVKGAILSVNPHALLVDITHDVTPHDIEEAAFTLLAAHSAFPKGSIHLAVVDPGVGSSRRPVAIESAGQYFVGPDNGIFSYVCERFGADKIIHLTNEQYFAQPVSQTFNGRDIFAPIAGALSLGVEAESLGTAVNDYVRLRSLQVERDESGKIAGRIIHIDRFGNCVTNFTRDVLKDGMFSQNGKLRVNQHSITSIRNYFDEKSDDPDPLFAVWGSAGFLELAARNESAANLANLKRGDEVVLVSD